MMTTLPDELDLDTLMARVRAVVKRRQPSGPAPLTR